MLANRNFYAAVQLVAALKCAGIGRENPRIQKLEKEFPDLVRPADVIAVEIASEIVLQWPSASEEDFEDFEQVNEEEMHVEEESPVDYYEDYFPDHLESLNNPRAPHLEP